MKQRVRWALFLGPKAASHYERDTAIGWRAIRETRAYRSRGGRDLTIFIVSKLTVITRSSSSSG